MQPAEGHVEEVVLLSVQDVARQGGPAELLQDQTGGGRRRTSNTTLSFFFILVLIQKVLFFFNYINFNLKPVYLCVCVCVCLFELLQRQLRTKDKLQWNVFTVTVRSTTGA